MHGVQEPRGHIQMRVTNKRERMSERSMPGSSKGKRSVKNDLLQSAGETEHEEEVIDKNNAYQALGPLK